ncbi:MAG: hypothetical protein V3T83_09650 [Acidobacteriota bacterium]
MLGDFVELPKVQRYFQKSEFYRLFSSFFRKVRVGSKDKNCTAICAEARPVEPARLSESLRFEFELPYPDGSKMGRSQQALDAFSKRLSVGLGNV